VRSYADINVSPQAIAHIRNGQQRDVRVVDKPASLSTRLLA